MSTHRKHPNKLIAVVGILSCMAGMIVFATASSPAKAALHAGIFAGALDADLGTRAMNASSEYVTHTFELVNMTQRSVSIDAVQPSCGCLSAESDRTEYGPGETVRITATMRLLKYGNKREFIQVLVDNAIWMKLSMHVDVDVTGRLVLSDQTLTLDESGTAGTWAFFLAADSSMVPGPITTKSTDVVIENGTWELVHLGDTAMATPARWRIPLTFQATTNAARIVLDLQANAATAPVLLLRKVRPANDMETH